MRKRLRWAALFAVGWAMASAPVFAQNPLPDPSRGELLYTTHCVACHNARVHWREQRLATDWNGLRAQVRRWENLQKLNWSNEDINEVAGYLDRFYYNFSSRD